MRNSRQTSKKHRPALDGLFVSVSFLAIAPPIGFVVSAFVFHGGLSLGILITKWVIVAIPMSYVFGGIPALFTGVMYSIASRALPKTKINVLVGALLGFCCGAIASLLCLELLELFSVSLSSKELLTSISSSTSNLSKMVAVPDFAVIGAFTGMIVGALLARYAPVSRRVPDADRAATTQRDPL